MALTYTYGDVLSMISPSIARGTEDEKSAHVCNIALNKVWMRYDWPEFMAVLPPFALTPGEQDHGAPAVAVPSDFGGLKQANLIQLSSIPAERTPIDIVRDLVLTPAMDLPKQICYLPATASFRVYPRVPLNMAAPLWQIDGTYKQNPTKVSASSIHSTLLPFDDRYLQVWVEMIRWAAWALAGDPRAGDVVYANRQTSFTGQLAKAMAAVDSMANDAGLILGDGVIVPQPDLWFGF